MPIYVVDTSAWINAWRLYPPDVPAFSRIWDGLDQMISSGSLCIPEEVLEELKKGYDGIPKWLNDRPAILRPLDAFLQLEVKRVMDAFPDLADEESDRSRGDPFVVGLGKLTSGVVVSGESPRKAPTARPKIPDACAGFGIRCIKWLEFLREPDVTRLIGR
jgi:hypothetical protein